MLIKPYYYQTEAVNSFFDYFEKKSGNPLIKMPTGTGKSLVLAFIIKRIFDYFPNQRIMMLTHVQELIEQNAEKMQLVWPTAPIGIHSAGLNSRDTLMPIIFGGIQSAAKTVKKANEENTHIPEHLRHFGWRDLIFIDEAHLVNPKEMGEYRYIISELTKINPYLKVVGLTATAYRLKQGLLTDDGLFTDICYDITGVEAFNRLIAQGYLSPLIAKPTKAQIDVSSVSVSDGEYNTVQLEKIFKDDKITFACCKETIEYGQDRKSWLVFCTGIDHVERATAIMQSFGIDAVAVHSKLPKATNSKNLAAFKNMEIRCILGMDKFTTGFDHPPIDLISFQRPTLSPAKHVQMSGRGTRPSVETGKVNCLGLDFAGNVKRLGPINDPVIPRKPGQKKGPSDLPIRICDFCGFYNHASARKCCNCEAEFTFKSKLFQTAGTLAFIKDEQPIIEFFNVQKVIYNLHEKKKDGVLVSPPSIKVSYICGLRMFSEWVCLEHKGLPAHSAKEWWRQRHLEEPPLTTYQALQRTSELRIPAKIKVHVNKPYPEILSYEY